MKDEGIPGRSEENTLRQEEPQQERRGAGGAVSLDRTVDLLENDLGHVPGDLAIPPTVVHFFDGSLNGHLGGASAARGVAAAVGEEREDAAAVTGRVDDREVVLHLRVDQADVLCASESEARRGLGHGLGHRIWCAPNPEERIFRSWRTEVDVVLLRLGRRLVIDPQGDLDISESFVLTDHHRSRIVTDGYRTRLRHLVAKSCLTEEILGADDEEGIPSMNFFFHGMPTGGHSSARVAGDCEHLARTGEFHNLRRRGVDGEHLIPPLVGGGEDEVDGVVLVGRGVPLVETVHHHENGVVIDVIEILPLQHRERRALLLEDHGDRDHDEDESVGENRLEAEILTEMANHLSPLRTVDDGPDIIAGADGGEVVDGGGAVVGVVGGHVLALFCAGVIGHYNQNSACSSVAFTRIFVVYF